MDNANLWLYKVTGKKKAYVVILAIAQATQGMLGVFFALLLRNVIDSAVAQNKDAFWQNVLCAILLVVCQIALAAFVRWMQELARANVENLLKRRLVDNILRKEYNSVASTHTAEWINRLTSDASVVANGFVEILPGVTGTFIRMIAAVVMVVILDPVFAAILLPAGIVMCAVAYAFRKILKRLHKTIQEKDGQLRVLLQEHIGNLMVIKSYAAEDKSCSATDCAMDAHKAARMRRNRFSNVVNVGFGMGMQGMYLVAAIYCAYGIMIGTVSYGTLVAIMQLVMQIQGPFASISGYLPQFYAMSASAERLQEIEGYADDKPARSREEVDTFYQGAFASLGLDHAHFTYETDKEAPIVLDDISLMIKKGEYVAFTGHSGCGKSTILKLLMCAYPLDQGKRYIVEGDDEIPLDTSWRRMFAYVPQGNALMNGTIRNVVSFAVPEAAHDEPRLREALAISCADEFVDDLDKELGERGSGLSEGQMQRIAIARAVFSGCPIVLLDESTSALDDITEQKLLENLRKLTDITVVIVTHRKAALSICDRILHVTQQGIEDVTAVMHQKGADDR